MDLILWRHAEAHVVKEGQTDLERALTTKGERQAQRMAHTTRIMVSPALRCQQTARALGRNFKTVDALGPQHSAQDLLAAARWPESIEPVLVVGHQPTLGLAAALVMTELPQPWSVKKGAVWWLRDRDRVRDEGAHVVLLAVQSPDFL